MADPFAQLFSNVRGLQSLGVSFDKALGQFGYGFKSLGFDDTLLKEYAQSGISANDLKSLKSAGYVIGIGLDSAPGVDTPFYTTGFQDVTKLVSDYNSWIKSREEKTVLGKQMEEDRKKRLEEFPGGDVAREQTIIAPYGNISQPKTVLGSLPPATFLGPR